MIPSDGWIGYSYPCHRDTAVIRKFVIVLLTFTTLGTSLLWADSYRRRVPKPLSSELEASLRNGDICPGPRDPLALVGLQLTRYLWDFSDPRPLADRKILRIRTCVGRLELRLDWSIKTGTYVRGVDVALAGFQHKQWMWRSSTWRGQNGQDIHDDYHVREVHVPFPAIVALFGSYPAWTLCGGPLRRRRRRARGLCLRCGYDLTGNASSVCPECGTKTTCDVDAVPRDHPTT